MEVTSNNHTYILRIWRESGQGSWRAIVQNVQDQSKVGFPTLAELMAYLEEIIQGLDDPPRHKEPPISSGISTSGIVQQ